MKPPKTRSLGETSRLGINPPFTIMNTKGRNCWDPAPSLFCCCVQRIWSVRYWSQIWLWQMCAACTGILKFASASCRVKKKTEREKKPQKNVKLQIHDPRKRSTRCHEEYKRSLDNWTKSVQVFAAFWVFWSSKLDLFLFFCLSWSSSSKTLFIEQLSHRSFQVGWSSLALKLESVLISSLFQLPAASSL